MSDYTVYHTPDTKDFVDRLSEKSQRICRDNLKKLADNPYPGKGIGDKEKIVVAGKEMYRLHIGRTWTAFYKILEGKKQVRLVEIVSINDAHDEYGY